MTENNADNPRFIEQTTETHIVRSEDLAYPERLFRLPDPPKRLFVKGRIPDGVMVAIVGTREADVSARRFTAKLAKDLASSGFVVISGGALGIDTAAHQGALDAGGPTVAVVGCGFDHLYPVANSKMFSRIAEQGALVTEFEKEQPPAKWTFPRRNRLVAALAGAVVVVQAGERSGALITARIAKDLDVPLGAVPGAPDNSHCRGSNRLLKEGAAVVEELEDVLSLVEKAGIKRQLRLPVDRVQDMKPAVSVRAKMSPAEVKIFDLLGSQPLHIDEISFEAGLNAGETSAALMALEIAGLVEDQGGKNYVRVG
jgi:DNA processing protein